MNKLTMSAGVAIAAAILATSARAEKNYLLATWTVGGMTEASWDQAFAPTPDGSIAGNYTEIPVWKYVDETDTSYDGATDVYYFAAPGGGWQDLAGDFGPTGAQIYTGSETAPVFAAGANDLGGGVLTLTAVPEPATWAMMLLGFGVAGSAARRRRAAIA